MNKHRFYLILTVFLLTSMASSAAVPAVDLEASPSLSIWESKDSSEVIAVIKEELEKANTSDLIYIFFEKENEHVFQSNTREELGRALKLSIFSKIGNVPHEQVGYIDFEIGDGILFLMKKDIDMAPVFDKETPHYAFLTYITIEPFARNKGYSSAALKVFHNLLDAIGVDYTVLEIESSNPYAGSLYRKEGYEFTKDTLVRIEKWGKRKDLSPEAAVSEFLKDTSQRIGSKSAMMVRYKK